MLCTTLSRKEEQLLVFDLRPRESYESEHIKGSVHAVCDAKAKETIMPNIPKNVKIILVDDDCKTATETVRYDALIWIRRLFSARRDEAMGQGNS